MCDRRVCGRRAHCTSYVLMSSDTRHTQSAVAYGSNQAATNTAKSCNSLDFVCLAQTDCLHSLNDREKSKRRKAHYSVCSLSSTTSRFPSPATVFARQNSDARTISPASATHPGQCLPLTCYIAGCAGQTHNLAGIRLQLGCTGRNLLLLLHSVWRRPCGASMLATLGLEQLCGHCSRLTTS